MDRFALKISIIIVFSFASQRCILARNYWYKDDDKRWIWGYAEDFITNESYPMPWWLPKFLSDVNTRTGPEADDYKKYEESCTDLGLKVPDFRAPGKRLAQVKCDEERWRVYNENENYKRYIQCIYYQTIKTEKESGQKVPFVSRFVGGGVNALAEDFPHMAAIGYLFQDYTLVYLCGGSLISRNYVLTAAHCTYAKLPGLLDPAPKIVKLGLSRHNPGDTFTGENKSYFGDYKIKRIIVHPQYMSPIKYYDIALLELEGDVNYKKNIQPACLWHDDDLIKLGNKATITGWGVTDIVTRSTASFLQAAEVDIIDTQLCNRLLRSRCNRKWCGVKDHQVCAGKLQGRVDACQGDSGGPIQVMIDLGLTPVEDKVIQKEYSFLGLIKEVKMHYVFGVTSFGFGCFQKNTPGIYTRVSSLLDWIEDIVWK